jgi:hypothetical protein
MKYKLTDDGKGIQIGADGHPIVEFEEGDKFNGESQAAGTEQSINLVHMIKKIPTLNEESKQHRIKAKALEEKLAVFSVQELEALEDTVKTWRETAGKVKTLEGQYKDIDEARKEIEKGWTEKIANVNKSWESKLAEKDSEVAKINQRLRTSVISEHFAKSKFFSGDDSVTMLPPDVADATFGKNFDVFETPEGKLIPVCKIDGSEVMSKQKPGEMASFDEAVGILIDSYPNRDKILRNNVKPGSGTQVGGNRLPSKKIARSDIGKYYNEVIKGEVQVE